jgi:hypothetical protein
LSKPKGKRTQEVRTAKEERITSRERRSQMFIPKILSVPVFSVLGSGAVLSPTVGEVLASMLIAAFVGSLLGVLREGLRGTERPRAAEKTVAESDLVTAPQFRRAPLASKAGLQTTLAMPLRTGRAVREVVTSILSRRERRQRRTRSDKVNAAARV